MRSPREKTLRPSPAAPPKAPQPQSKSAGLARRLGNQETQRILAAHIRTDGVEPLPHRDAIEQSFGPGHNLDSVRATIGGHAAVSNALLGSSAFTRGEHVAFRSPPTLDEAAHEAAHVIQQRQGARPAGGLSEAGDPWEQQADAVAGRVTRGEFAAELLGAPAPPTGAANPPVQRRLIVHGNDVDFDDFLAFVEPATGLVFSRDPLTDEVTAVGSSLLPATSPFFNGMVSTIVDDTTQDAEVQLGTHQSATGPGGTTGSVLVGAFPFGVDFIQTVDMDDLDNVEAGAPGRGVAFLAHELMENYIAHALPAGGASLGISHNAANVAEEAVSQDLFGPGDELLEYIAPNPAGGSSFIEDYENYLVVMDFQGVPPPPLTSAPPDTVVTGARQVAPTVVNTFTIDNFTTGSDIIPGAGVASITAAAALLTADPRAALHIEGFTDDIGSTTSNAGLGGRRAENAKLIVGAALANRVATFARGETSFVAPNTSDANRAQNRRIVLTVVRP
ncbi:MAG: DUF4157 domain-containing protein [Acidobacteriota bacterium]